MVTAWSFRLANHMRPEMTTLTKDLLAIVRAGTGPPRVSMAVRASSHQREIRFCPTLQKGNSVFTGRRFREAPVTANRSGGLLARADLGALYVRVRVWGAGASFVFGVIFASMAQRPELWLIPVVCLPTIIHGIRHWTTSAVSLTLALLIDFSVVGVLITVVGLEAVAVAYGLGMVAVASVIAPRSRLRFLFPYVGAWMATALAASRAFSLEERWSTSAATIFSISHVLLVAVAVGLLLTLMMQRLRDIESERSQLIGGFTHDIKNALTGALGMAELLSNHLDKLQPEEIIEYASIVVAESREAVAMSEDLLVLERAEAGSLDVSTESVDLRLEATRVLDSTGSEATLEAIDGSPPPLCVGDSVRIRQILRNLVSNADRYGGECLEVSTGIDGASAYLRVADNGSPIPESEREHIFNAYQRARHRERHSESVGLGLTISRYLARLMGGDLTYRHTDGWSIFELTLPRVEPTKDTPLPGEMYQPIATEVEQIWLGADGILRSRVLPGARITLEHAQVGVAGYADASGGARRPLLVYAENVSYLSPQARWHYARSEAAAECISAVALLVLTAPIARALANHMSRFSNPPFPTRLFDDQDEALAWLEQVGSRPDPVQL